MSNQRLAEELVGWGCVHRRMLMQVVLCSLATFALWTWAGASGLEAQPLASGSHRAVQFVFVIDDSKSMRETDPERLSVFAARSILDMLDERDEATVVRLDGPAQDEAPLPVAPVGDQRLRLQESLDLGDQLAGYGAGYTRCRTALAAVKDMLNVAYRSDVAQVVFFLTDGACTPDTDEVPSVTGFLSGLRSHDAGLFRFYFLRFQGMEFTSALAQLAERTGGQSIEVGTRDPTGVLRGFAEAMSASQGYESALLTPQDNDLPGHQGARRVRLLAVARGEGEPLDIEVRDRYRRPMEGFKEARAGSHQFPGGEVFRYIAFDYRPNGDPVYVDVLNAGGQWKVVALPEYLLAASVQVFEGECDGERRPVRYRVDRGRPVCVEVRLVDEKGQIVSADVSGSDLEAHLLFKEEGKQEWKELAGNPAAGGEARYFVQRSRLESGGYSLQPQITLRADTEQEVTFTGVTRGLEIASLEMEVSPAVLDFGSLLPGQTQHHAVELDGVFPESRLRLVLPEESQLGDCLEFRLQGDENEGVDVAVGQQVVVEARLDTFCGPKAFQRTIDTPLYFDPVVLAEGGGETYPGVTVTARLKLDYDPGQASGPVLHLKAGQSEVFELELGGNAEGEVSYLVEVQAPQDSAAWPADAGHLTLGFARGDQLLRRDGASVRQQQVVAQDVNGNAQPLRLFARADHCCGGGSYRTQVAVADPAGLRDPLLIPVTLEVSGGSFWSCWGRRILFALLALLLALLCFYIYRMWSHSSWLDRRRLATQLKPLVWSSYGGTSVNHRSQEEVEAWVRRNLRFRDRALAWIRANPFRIGWFGGSYEETLELTLAAKRDVESSSLQLISERAFQMELYLRPDSYRGRLFASAAGTIAFLGVPDARGHFSRLVVEGQEYVMTPGEVPAKVTRLNRKNLVQPKDLRDLGGDGGPAGWRLGA
ncbi:MAG: vWA domain-containing protein [Acidobacteriota bacterium]